MKTNPLFCVLLLLVLSSCSTAIVRVLPGEESNKVVSTDYERDDAEKAAISEATDYCLKFNKRVAFMNRDQSTKYVGSMDESTRNNVKNASKAAMILSAPAGVASNSGAVGGVLGGAGLVGHQMTNNRDYKTEIDFKCL